MAFSGFAGVSAVAQFVSDHVPLLGWLRGLARRSQIPAATVGRDLLPTRRHSSPRPVHPPRQPPRTRSPRGSAHRPWHRRQAPCYSAKPGDHSLHGRGVAPSRDFWSDRDKFLPTPCWRWPRPRARSSMLAGSIFVLPLGLYAASLAVLAGSLILRISALGVGADSARRPEVSFRFSQPRGLDTRFRGTRQPSSRG